MRKHKTSKNKRTSYVFRSVVGTSYEITTDDADEEWITMEHGFDDDEYDAQRREEYHVPEHYAAYNDATENEISDYNSYMADEDADPLNILINKYEEIEHQQMIEKLQRALADLSPEQRELIDKKFCQNMSNVKIAEDLGVDERTIRRRLSSIYEILKKKL